MLIIFATKLPVQKIVGRHSSKNISPFNRKGSLKAFLYISQAIIYVSAINQNEATFVLFTKKQQKNFLRS